jgi:2-(1,2-epoxy-1,2-dihydrophenyl)acetyl-CoA isomerase
MDWEHIRLEVSDSIATVTLHRPSALNALAGSMRVDLCEAIQEAAKCSRVLVVTGAGRGFCSGGDIHFMTTATDSDLKSLIRQGMKVVTALRSVPIPTLASLNGVAAGAGLGLALACDLRIASRSVHLAATFSKVGLHPDWGVSYFLTRLAGSAVARELVFTGRRVDAEEALRRGLVNWVVEPEELEAETRSRAEELRNAAPTSLEWAKRTIERAETASLEETLDLEEEAQLACFRSEDAREGLRAFVEKRRPSFKGRTK